MDVSLISMFHVSPMLVKWTENNEQKEAVLYVDFANEKVLSDNPEYASVSTEIIKVIKEKKNTIKPLPFKTIKEVFDKDKEISNARGHKL